MDMDINTQLLFSTSSRRSKNDGINSICDYGDGFFLTRFIAHAVFLAKRLDSKGDIKRVRLQRK